MYKSVFRCNLALAIIACFLMACGGGGGGSTSNSNDNTPITPSQTTGFSITGSLNRGRFSHTATLLPNGKVLIAGGNSGGTISSAELYDPSTGQFTTTGSLNIMREGHTAVLLQNGKVLIAGGYAYAPTWKPITTAEIYDPDTETFTYTGSTPFYNNGEGILLRTGEVLILGTTQIMSTLYPESSIFKPIIGIFPSTTGSLPYFVNDYRLAMLPNGNIFVSSVSQNLIYDVNSETFSTVTGVTNSDNHTATNIQSGQILIAGGGIPASSNSYLYSSDTNLLTATGSLLYPRYNHSATVLPSGNVLIAGGVGNSVYASSEIYVPSQGGFSITVPMNVQRAQHTATRLSNGKVLIVGGWNYSNTIGITTAELYQE